MADRYPLDKGYAIASNVVVQCYGPSPTGSRSNMRPAYAANPLTTVVGNQSNGQTDAYALVSYWTRVYFSVETYTAPSGHTLKFNKIFMLWEDNEIFALGDTGQVMGLDMIEDGGTATHAFVLWNSANESRTYRITIMDHSCVSNVPCNRSSSNFNVWVDDDQDGIKDVSETTELISQGTVTIAANTDLYLVAQHNPTGGEWHDTNSFYGRRLADASFTIVQEGRMRTTGTVQPSLRC